MEQQDFRPTAPLQNLVERAFLLRRIRRYFDSRGFIEVQTPVLSQDSVLDVFVEPIAVPLEVGGSPRIYYLQTSPEFAMKRLVASGATAIYQITPAFRKGDRGEWHNVEFSMLEWYRVGDDYRRGRKFLADFVRSILTDRDRPLVDWGRMPELGSDSEFDSDSESNSGLKPDSTFSNRSSSRRIATFPNASFVEADSNESFDDSESIREVPFATVFENATGLNPHFARSSEFRAFADSVFLDYPASFLDKTAPASENDWIDLIFSSVVQPNLKSGRKFGRFDPIVLFDYPATQSQLAKTRPLFDGDANSTRRERTANDVESRMKNDSIAASIPFVSERFELFVNGIELANGYNELRDADVLRRRNERTQKERSANRLPDLPTESRLLAAMDAGFPQCSGCALGIDRLLMVLLGTDSIDDVISFPIEKA